MLAIVWQRKGVSIPEVDGVYENAFTGRVEVTVIVITTGE